MSATDSIVVQVTKMLESIEVKLEVRMLDQTLALSFAGPPHLRPYICCTV